VAERGAVAAERPPQKPVGWPRRPPLLSGHRARGRGGDTREHVDMGAPLRGHGRAI